MNYDKKFAEQLIGKTILIGVNIVDDDNKIESQQQMFGIVFSVSENEGVLINLKGEFTGKEWLMPPDTRYIQVAESGNYKLNESGERIKNPDYTCNWQVQRSIDNK